MNPVVIIVQLLFIFYYAYVIYVFYKLHQNSCQCDKLEGFKKTWNFRYISIVTPLLFLYSVMGLIKIFKEQNGGSMYQNVLAIISLCYFSSFVNDYAIISLFHTMKKKNCPCQTKNREILTTATYVKAIVNLYIYVKVMAVLDKKFFNKIKKKMEKEQKKSKG